MLSGRACLPSAATCAWQAECCGLDWMEKYACCAGCENGGGPPDCTIRICARERGYELCSSCPDLDTCTRFEWLKEHGSQLKGKLKENRGLSKVEYIKKMMTQMPWEA